MFQLKVFPGGRERDDTDTQSFLSLIFLFLFFPLSLSVGAEGWDVCLLSARGSDNDTVQVREKLWKRETHRTRKRVRRPRDGKIKMHKKERERNVREGLLWYWSLEALLNAGCGRSLPRVRGYHSCMVWLYFPLFLHLPLTSSRYEFLVATDHQSSILVSPCISLDCTYFKCLSCKGLYIFTISALRKLQRTTFLKWSMSCLNELHNNYPLHQGHGGLTTRMAKPHCTLSPYPRLSMQKLAMTQVWNNNDSLEAFNAHGKAWPQYWVTSSLKWKEVQPSLGVVYFHWFAQKRQMWLKWWMEGENE